MKSKKDEFPMPQMQGNIDAGLTGALPDMMEPATTLHIRPRRWELLTVVKGETADLNSYAAEGWELVSVTTHGFNESTYYFKRLKS